MRVSAFIDGFNLYHAIDDEGADYLKWVNLRLLCEQFAPAPQYSLGTVYYCSAFATWLPDKYRRHRTYVKALEAAGVTPVMGRFKDKDRRCRLCSKTAWYHEEKETDVNLAIQLIRGAYRDEYDRALLFSADSDLAPALRMFRADFPQKEIQIIAPVGRSYSMDMINAAGGKHRCSRIQRIHLERCLLPKDIKDPNGRLVASRPLEYQPPKALRPARFP